MVIKYSAPELIAIGEMVILKECVSRMPEQQEVEPRYHQVYVPPVQDPIGTVYGGTSTARMPSNSISADLFIEDYAQFQNHLSQSIQFNRDIHLHLQAPGQQRQNRRQGKHQQLSESVAEFFKKAQQNFHPAPSASQPDSTTQTRARRLSEVEAELLAQLRGHIYV